MADEDLEVRAILSADASKFITPFQQATVATQQLHKALKPANGALIGLGAAVAATGYSLFKFGKEAFGVAARVSEMNVAMKAVGKATGLGEKAIKDTANAVRSQGIEMASAQKIALTYAQNNLNLADASKVARVAQDLAVITQKNSTDTAELLNRAIQTGSTILLKSAGITKYASEGYKAYAKVLGKSTNELTALERQQATTNMILEEGRKVAGLYEAAMTEPGKVLRSFARLQDDIKVEMGSALLQGFGPTIKATYDLTKAFSESLREGGFLHGVLKEVGSALVSMTQPLTDGIMRLARFIKSMKDSGSSVDGLKEKLTKFTPIILAVSTALSAFAGRSLLTLVGLGKLGAKLNPLTAGFAVLVALSPRLRDAFGKMVKSLMPLVPAAINLGRAFAEFAATAVDAFANLLDSGFGVVIETALKAMSASVMFLTGVFQKFKPLLFIVGAYITKTLITSMWAASMKAEGFAYRIVALRAGFTNLLGAYKFAVAEQMRYNYTLSQGGFAITKFSTMATVGFRMVAIAAKSLIVSLAPMIAIFAAVAIFSKFREAQQKVKDRTDELTQAFKEQVYALKGNSVEVATFVSKLDTLGNIFATTGEGGEKLAGAMNLIGLATGDIAKLAQGGEQGLKDFNKEMRTTAGLGEGLSITFDGKVYEGLDEITKSLTAEQQAYARSIGAVNEALKGTNLVDVINQQMALLVAQDKSASGAYLYAIAEAEKQGVLEGGVDTVGEAIEVNNIFKAKYLELAKAAKKAKDEETAKTDAVKVATHATKSLYDRLELLKSANEDGKVSVEAFAKEMFGAKVDTNTFAEAVDNMRKQSSELGNSVEKTKGNFDAFTSSGFDLYNQITKNSSSLLELGGNSADVRDYMKSTIEQFKKGAKAAGYTDDEITNLLNSLGLISGLAQIDIKVKIDLEGAQKQLMALAGVMSALYKAGGGLDKSSLHRYEQLEERIKSLTKATAASSSSFKDYNTATGDSGKESKEVTKEKERLRKAIMKIANEALKKATERLEEYNTALNAMKEASRSAIYGAYSMSEALSKAERTADEANDKLEALRDTQLDYGKSIKESIGNALSFNEALSEQVQSASELKSANDKVADANKGVVEQQAEYNRLLEVANSSVGRKNRREAYEKAADQALELAKAQDKLALATADATAEQGKQQSFMARLREQAQLATTFSSQLAKLAESGLEKEAFDQIVTAGAKTGSQMAKELIDGGSEAIKETNELFKKIADVSFKSGEKLSENYMEIGSKVGADFIAALASQAKEVSEFAETIKRLVALGLSPQNIQMVLNAGYEAGSKIAKFLEDGGAETIAQVNGFEVSLRTQGEGLADLLGDTFYQAGFDLATQVVDGIKEKIEELEDFLADATIEQMKAYLAKVQAEFDALLVKLPEKAETVTGKPLVVVDPTVAQATQFATSNSGSLMSNIAEQTAVSKGFITQAQADELFGRRVTPFANGGVVKAPTLGMVGEAGPEAIIPLSRMGDMGGSTNINLTVNAGYGADGRAIGDVIVNELKKWSRKNGKIPVATQ